jgi:hypothetical protein
VKDINIGSLFISGYCGTLPCPKEPADCQVAGAVSITVATDRVGDQIRGHRVVVHLREEWSGRMLNLCMPAAVAIRVRRKDFFRIACLPAGMLSMTRVERNDQDVPPYSTCNMLLYYEYMAKVHPWNQTTQHNTQV